MPFPAAILRSLTNHVPLRRGFAKVSGVLKRRLNLVADDQWLELPAPGLGTLAVNPARPVLLAHYLFTRPMTRSYLRSPLARYMRQTLTPSGVFIDAGANLGFYTLLASLQTPAESVIAFEPEPTIFESLSRTIKLNDLANVRLHQLALSDAEGSTQLIIHRENYGGHSIASTPGKGKTSTEVKTDTLTAIIDREKNLDPQNIELIKIDVEGAETPVIKGLQELLERDCHPVIHCEVRGADVKRSGGSAVEVAELLKPFSYKPHRLDSRGYPRPVTAANIKGIADLTFLAEDRCQVD